MCQVNVLEAKTNFSKLLAMLERREESEVIICRNGTPVAKITPYERDRSKAFGIAKGMFTVPDDFDDMMADEIAELFGMNGNHHDDLLDDLFPRKEEI